MGKASIFGAIVTALVTAACSHAGAQEAGPEISRNFDVGAFDRIEISGPFEVQVHTGSDLSVAAKGPQALVERMHVEVRDGRLLIRPRRDEGRTISWGSRGHVAVQVTVPSLHGAQIAGAGGIRIDRVHGERFDAGIHGSGDISVDSVETAAFAAEIAGSGNVRAASGAADKVELKIGGSGNIDTQGMAARSGVASIAGSGDISARVTETAEVRIMGSGNVAITGGAKCTVKNHGSGNFRCS